MPINREELDKLVVKWNSSIRQVMETITENYHEVALVEDETGHIVGVITDGDIRRGLLRGMTVASPAVDVMTENYIFVGPDMDRALVLDMMKARSIRHIPIVDSERRLLGVHFLQDLIGSDIKPNIAVIMAGGKGVRLRPLTGNCPKPMIRVAGRPILERIVLQLVGHGIRKIHVAINYLGEQIEDYFGDGRSFGCSIEYLREETPLGTGGALSLLTDRPAHPFLVMNGDLVTQVNITSLLRFHQEKGMQATIACRPYQVEIPFGVIKEKRDRLVSIQEKPPANYLVNAGIYVINPSVLDLVPSGKDFPMTSLFELLLRRKTAIGVYTIEEDWIDVGKHEELRKANGL